MYIGDNGYGYQVWMKQTKLAEFVTFEQAMDFIAAYDK